MIRSRAIAALAVLLASVPVMAAEPPKANVEHYPSPAAATRALPYSEAVRVGNLMFLSGQLGTVPGTTGLAPGGTKAETKQALENIKAILERRGASLKNVVKCTVMMADMKEWPDMNEVYVTFFDKDRLPARSAFGANALALGARLEIECIAALP